MAAGLLESISQRYGVLLSPGKDVHRLTWKNNAYGYGQNLRYSFWTVSLIVFCSHMQQCNNAKKICTEKKVISSYEIRNCDSSMGWVPAPSLHHLLFPTGTASTDHQYEHYYHKLIPIQAHNHYLLLLVSLSDTYLLPATCFQMLVDSYLFCSVLQHLRFTALLAAS